MNRWRLGRDPRWRTRTLVIGGLLLLASTGMLVAAGAMRGFAGDLLLNLGSSMVLAAVSYLIFDPIFDEARKARVQEHDRFDQAGFIDRMRETNRNIRILDTWTLLLELRNRERTFDAMRKVLDQGATIRVLLLDPNSAAALQRTEELERRQIDVGTQIMDNLRQLHLFRDQLPSPEMKSQLNVRVYDASPSIQLYQWDDRALISFFPIGEVSFDVPQLEVDMASPWGQFVDRRFDELWDQHDHVLSLDRYWLIAVTLTQDSEPLDTVLVRYVGAEHEVYLDGAGNLANRLAGQGLPVQKEQPEGQKEQPKEAPTFGAIAVWPARRSGQQTRHFDLIRLDDQHTPEPAEVLRRFDRKYGDYRKDRPVFLLRLDTR